MTKLSSKGIVEYCLNSYWNSCSTDFYGGGWDIGSPAYLWAIKWIKKNYKEFRKLSNKQIYLRYVKSLVQE